MKFQLGRIFSTPGALRCLTQEEMLALLARHMDGDWGVVDAEDRATNDYAVVAGARILSAYAIDPTLPCKGHGANTVWVVTEGDRRYTTFLLPEEY